jgi:NAD+ synthase (glutamine-hydrolysing)
MTLAVILAAEISEELVPVENSEKLQSTEAAIYTLRFGFHPSKIACMALHAWKDEREGEWPAGFPPTGGARTESVKFGPGLKYSCGVFCLRQFTCSAMPNGPNVSAGGSLSPGGDWRAPSNASAAA